MDYGRQSSWRTRRRRYSGCRKGDAEHRRILSGLRINPSGCRSRRATVKQDGFRSLIEQNISRALMQNVCLGIEAATGRRAPWNKTTLKYDIVCTLSS